MKTHRNLGLAALVVFIISFFLPAFEDMSGFASFAFCWDTLLGHEPSGNIRILSGGWFYYSGFVMSNILFVGLVAALFLTRKIGRLTSVFSLVCFLQALSWLVLFTISGKRSQITAIKVGYYVWLIAYGLLVTAYLWKMMSNHIKYQIKCQSSLLTLLSGYDSLRLCLANCAFNIRARCIT